MDGLMREEIIDLELSMRAYNCLVKADIRTVAQIEQMTDKNLDRIKYCGPVSINEIRDAVRIFRGQQPVSIFDEWTQPA